MMFTNFCFFKQKTAYEMRISDWSSDVCSSDLKRADQAKSSRLPPLQQGRSVLVALRGPRGSIQHERMRPRTVAPPRLCQANAAGEVECEPAADQIGSASCRERVCRVV